MKFDTLNAGPFWSKEIVQLDGQSLTNQTDNWDPEGGTNISKRTKFKKSSRVKFSHDEIL